MEQCIKRNLAGVEFHELTCLYPDLGQLYFRSVMIWERTLSLICLNFVPINNVIFTSSMFWIFNLICSWEKEYETVIGRDWMREVPMVPIVGVCLYMFLIATGRHYMSSKNAGNWRNCLVSEDTYLKWWKWFIFIALLNSHIHLVFSYTYLST